MDCLYRRGESALDEALYRNIAPMPTRQRSYLDHLAHGQRQKLLLRLIRSPSSRQLARTLARVHPADIAPLFPLLKPGEQDSLLEALFELRMAAPTISEMDPQTLRQVLEELANDRLSAILGRLPADDAVDLLDQLDPERAESLLGSLEPALAARLNNLMLYGATTAGGKMDPAVVSFRGDLSLAQAVEEIRRLAQSRRLFYLYVTDDRGHLIGLVKLWQLLSATAETRLDEIMSRDLVSVQVDAPQEDVARIFVRYDLPMMPVLDLDGRLAGVITADDVFDVLEEEASTDLYRLGGLSVPETLGTPLKRVLRFRVPWLLSGLAAALVAAILISQFQETLAKYVILAAFMHPVAAASALAGQQTLTVLLGSLATREMDLRRTWSVIGRQAAVGLVNGIIVGSILAVAALIWERNLVLGGILFVASTLSLVISSAAGAVLPLLLRRFDLDPALGSSVLVVGIADITGFLCFLGLASTLVERLV
jgi:magnesium transporter